MPDDPIPADVARIGMSPSYRHRSIALAVLVAAASARPSGRTAGVGHRRKVLRGLQPAGTGRLDAALDRALAKLATHRRLLVIGAHPTTKNTSVLALVSRQLGGEAAYLSLSRARDGQNLIGGSRRGARRSAHAGAPRGARGRRARQVLHPRLRFVTPGPSGNARQVARRGAPRRRRARDPALQPQVILSVFGDARSGGHGQHSRGHTAFLAFPALADDT